MYSGKKINSRGRGRGRGGGGNYQNQQQGQGQGQGPGRGGGRGRGGNHSGFTDQQQRTTRSPIRGNSGGFRGFRHSIQQDRRQLSVQGQSQEGAGPSSGRRGIRRERPWGSTSPLPSVLLQRAQSILDNLEIQALKISEQPASPAESVENRIVPPDRGGPISIQSILSSLLLTFLRHFILCLLHFAMEWISSI